MSLIFAHSIFSLPALKVKDLLWTGQLQIINAGQRTTDKVALATSSTRLRISIHPNGDWKLQTDEKAKLLSTLVPRRSLRPLQKQNSSQLLYRVAHRSTRTSGHQSELHLAQPDFPHVRTQSPPFDLDTSAVPEWDCSRRSNTGWRVTRHTLADPTAGWVKTLHVTPPSAQHPPNLFTSITHPRVTNTNLSTPNQQPSVSTAQPTTNSSLIRSRSPLTPKLSRPP
ncbi:hypothetical protein RRG08_014643 [Elysia crispata]|uniref:Uncharacterized protein n=1 Tax=Elysia crispata TaxID=231223 RepID=A0AAE0YIJ3_9GAST|nr:hypothetical protein RRG08_014643 [Elysia crispata]